MRTKIKKLKLLSIFLFFLLNLSIFSQSDQFSEDSLFINYRQLASINNIDESKFEIFNGGLIDIPSGSFVEGSIEHNGIQPHYEIDYDSEEFDELKRFANNLRNDSSLQFFDKIESIQKYINSHIIINKKYDSPNYINTLKKFRDQRSNIPLSQYRVCASGVCREHALIFHMALKEAGINNFHVYVKAFDGVHSEDHAVNVVIYQGEEWVVDCYNPRFNGYRLKDLMSEEAITTQTSVFHRDSGSWVRHGFLKINDFPKIYIPKNAKFIRYKDTLKKSGFFGNCKTLISNFFSATIN